MPLTEQYAALYAAWKDAHLEEESFRDHLIGIGAVSATADDLYRLTIRFLNQVKGAVENLRAQQQ